MKLFFINLLLVLLLRVVEVAMILMIHMFPNKVKNMNVKVFNLILRVNKTRFLAQHKSCECKCGLNEIICNSKQKWDPDEYRCESKELDD